jgi:integrase
LAAEASIQVDFSKLAGKYSSSKPESRNLPPDELIVEWFFKIVDPAWRWGYGMIATYGLRPHELFNLDLQHFIETGQMLYITGGKTGAHEVWPFNPEWVELFNLQEVNLPEVHPCETNTEYGHKCWYYLRKKANLPFNLYDLRHTWAVRAMKLGLADTLAARQMGHSVAVHTKTYLHWINIRDQQEAFDQLMQKRAQEQAQSDRPSAKPETSHGSTPKNTEVQPANVYHSRNLTRSRQNHLARRRVNGD